MSTSEYSVHKPASWHEAALAKVEGLEPSEQIVQLQFESVVRAMEIFHKAGHTGEEAVATSRLLVEGKFRGKTVVREWCSQPFQLTNYLEHNRDPTYIEAIASQTEWYFKRKHMPASLGRLALAKTKTYRSVTFIQRPGYANQAEESDAMLDIWRVDFPDSAPLELEDTIGIDELFRILPVISLASESLNLKPELTFSDIAKAVG